MFSCSTQLSMYFFLLLNVKMPSTIVGILIFISRKNSIIGSSEPEKADILDIFIILSISCSAGLSINFFITSGPV